MKNIQKTEHIEGGLAQLADVDKETIDTNEKELGKSRQEAEKIHTAFKQKLELEKEQDKRKELFDKKKEQGGKNQ